MLLAIVLSLIILVSVFTEKRPPISGVLLAFSIPLFFLLLWYTEYSSGRMEFFISDELHYITIGSLGFPQFSDRFLYYLINFWIINYDIFLNGLSLKIINIPFFVGLLYLIYKIFDKTKNVFILPIILPYIAYSAIFNMRDIIILFFTALTIYLYFEKKNLLFSIISLVLLYFLRPFAALFLLAIIISPYLWRFLRNLLKGRFHLNSFVLIFVMLLFMLAVIEPISNKVASYQTWLEYTTGEGEEAHIENVAGGNTSGIRSLDFVISSSRYILTPQPYSLAKRLFTGGSEAWGAIDDLIRVFNQIGYYLIILYLLFNVKFLPKVIQGIKFSQVALILSFLSYWPIYSFHLYGATHQRLKIPFQIALFLMVILVMKYKKRKPENE